MRRSLATAAVLIFGQLDGLTAMTSQMRHRRIVNEDLTATSLSSSSPCGPKRSDLATKLAGIPDIGREVPPFFLHDAGAFDFAPAIDCLFSSVNSTPGVDDLDVRLMPNYTEHLADLWIFDALRKHPSRTSDPKEAALHVVGAPFFASYVAAQAESSACGGMKEHLRRADGVAASLEASPHFARCDGCDFIFVDTSPWHLEDVFGPRLLALLRPRPVFLATADHQYHEWQFFRDSPWQLLILPYKAHFFTEATTKTLKLAKHSLEEHRNISFMFHGNIAGRHNEGEHRTILHTLARKLREASVPGLSIKNVDFNTFESPEDFAQVSLDTATAFTRSSFCLVPAGDSPSSRRLYDALAAGCVPVILGSFVDIAENLPFKETVRWSDIAVFAGSLECIGNETESVTKWMRGLTSKVHRPTVMRTRELGQREFRRSLSYVEGGVAIPLLREAAAALASPHHHLPRARGYRGVSGDSPR